MVLLYVIQVVLLKNNCMGCILFLNLFLQLQGKKLSAMHYGPPENSHVASVREALTHFAVSLSRKEWSKEERENLAKGVKQQFQEMLLQRSVDLLRYISPCSCS